MGVKDYKRPDLGAEAVTGQAPAAVILTYTGRVQLVGGKVGAKFQREGGEPVCFDFGKSFRGFKVGARYEFTEPKPGTFKIPAPAAAFRGMTASPEQVLEWEVADDVVATKERMAKLHKGEAADGFRKALGVLDPIVRVYRKTDADGRAAIEAAVIRYIQKRAYMLEGDEA